METRKQLGRRITREIIDNNTGEVLVSEDLVVKVGDIDKFIMFFLTNNDYFYHLTGTQIKVLSVLWKESTYKQGDEGNIIHNNKNLKTSIKSKMPSITDGMIDNVFSTLSRQNVLIKTCKGEYILNPEYFFKGRLSDRSKCIKRVVEFVIKPESMKSVSDEECLNLNSDL